MTAISRIECSRRHSLRCVVFPVPGDAPGVPTIIAVLNPGSFVPHIFRSPLRNIVLPDSGHGSEAARAGSGGLLAAILACVGCLIVYSAGWRAGGRIGCDSQVALATGRRAARRPQFYLYLFQKNRRLSLERTD
jgi:hypothetical protein